MCDTQFCGQFIDNNLENLVGFWGKIWDLQAFYVEWFCQQWDYRFWQFVKRIFMISTLFFVVGTLIFDWKSSMEDCYVMYDYSWKNFSCSILFKSLSFKWRVSWKILLWKKLWIFKIVFGVLFIIHYTLHVATYVSIIVEPRCLHVKSRLISLNPFKTT